MPLSDHEQRLLSQMEQQLLSEDPKFASAMRGAARRTGRRVLVGSVAVVVGLLLLVVAVSGPTSSQVLNVVLGVAAFLVMLAGAGYAMSSPKKQPGPVGVVGSDGQPQPRPAPPRAARHSGFMERLEQRWQRRRDER